MRRVLSGLLVAVALATGLTYLPTSWTPICATFAEGSIDWYLFLCFIDPPPKDPQG
jgi:hypothetical protein